MPGRGIASAIVAAVVAVLVLAGCEMRVEVAVNVESGGAGSVAVAVGFDDAAVDRLGDPTDALALDDLAEVGWSVDPIERDSDGITWVRAARTFEDPEGFAAVLNEVAGADGPLTGSSLMVDRGLVNTTTQLVGVVDLSAGLAPYADADLTAATGGVPFAGLITGVEAEFARPVADMVPVSVTWTVGTDTAVVTPRLGDPPVTVELSQQDRPLQWLVLPLAVVAVVAVVGLTVGIVQRRQGRRRGIAQRRRDHA